MKQTYRCTHDCMFRGLTRKGATVTIDAADLGLPENARLREGSSFVLVSAPAEHGDPSTPSAPSDPSAGAAPSRTPPESVMLRQRLAALNVTAPAKATLAELKALLAEAADPAGAAIP